MTEYKIRGKLREYENKHDELEHMKCKINEQIEDEHYFVTGNMCSNEQVRYELCNHDDTEIINVIDNTYDTLGIVRMQNFDDDDEVRNEVQREHRRLFNEEDKLYQQLIIMRHQDNKMR